MTHHQHAHAHPTPPESTPTTPPQTDASAAYEPPAILYRAPLEVTAAFCDPQAGGKTPLDNCFMIINS